MKTFEDFRREVLTIIDEKYDGSMIEYIYSLQCKIKRLEAEREELLRLVKEDGDCYNCKHYKANRENPYCRDCTSTNDLFEWKGMPTKEGADGNV